MMTSGRLPEHGESNLVIVQSPSASDDLLSPMPRVPGSQNSMRKSNFTVMRDYSGQKSPRQHNRRSIAQSDQVSEFASPVLSPNTTRYIKRSSKPSILTPFVPRKFNLTSTSRLSGMSLTVFSQMKQPGYQARTRLTQQAGISDLPSLNMTQEKEYLALKEEILLAKMACSDLRHRRSQAIVNGGRDNRQAVMQMIQSNALYRKMKELQARLYKANQRIDNSRRRLAKISGGLRGDTGSRYTEQSVDLLKECSEAQLIEMLGCQRLEFVSKIEFESSLNSLLQQRLARIEALAQAKSMITRIPNVSSTDRPISSRKMIEIMREKKNTITTEKMFMPNASSGKLKYKDSSPGSISLTKN